MRHGDADPPISGDADRPLSERGQREVAHMAEEIISCQIDLSQICCSPLLRAQQSAAIVSRILARSDQIEVWDELVPGGSCSVVASKLNQRGRCDTLMVSHQPFVGRMVNYLTGEEWGMGTGTVACIHTEALDQFCGEVEWLGPDMRT